MKRLLVVSFFSLFLLAAPASGGAQNAQEETYQAPDAPYRTQIEAINNGIGICLEKGESSTAEILECVDAANTQLDAMLNEVYKIVRASVKDDKVLYDSLKNEQVSWIKLKDLMLNRIQLAAQGGTIGLTNRAGLLNSMLTNRVDLLLTFMVSTSNE